MIKGHMTAESPLPRYYQRSKDVRKQLPMLLPIVGMFVVMVIYALGLRNEMTRTIFLYTSLAFPALIAFCLLASIRKLTYYQIDSAGVHMTIMGIFHKRIYWSDIESIGPATIGNVEGIGIMYSSSFNRHVWGRKTRQKMWGWDEILANAQTEDGDSFTDALTGHFKKYLRGHKG